LPTVNVAAGPALLVGHRDDAGLGRPRESPALELDAPASIHRELGGDRSRIVNGRDGRDEG
jgi:hypothetical protein